MESKKEQNKQSNPALFPAANSPYNNRSLKDWLILALWILAVVAVGMLAINQTFKFFYKVEFLKSPCMLCGELNPEVQDCIDILNSARESYPDGSGGWTDPFSTTNYNITIYKNKTVGLIN